MRRTEGGLRWTMLALAGCAGIAACQPGEDRATSDTGMADTTPTLGTGLTTGMSESQALGTIAAVHQSEVRMGQLAQERASNRQVRSFAQRVREEHEAFLQRMRQLTQNVDTSAADPALVQMARSTMERLRSLQGAAFDTAFVNAQVSAHEAALRKLDEMGRTDSVTGGDTTGAVESGSLQAYVRDSRRLIERHLQDARQLRQQLEG